MADIEELRRLQDENAWLHARLVEITKGMRVKQLAGGSKAVVSLLQNEVREKEANGFFIFENE